MIKQEPPRFWHVRSQLNPALVETYCLTCFKFIGASRLTFNISLVELAHRVVCKPSEQAGFPAAETGPSQSKAQGSDSQ